MNPTSLNLKQKVMDYARVEFAPSATLFKFYLLQLLGAALTLLICPQFGVGPWGGGHGITHWVMNFGPAICGAFCGLVYLGTGTALAVCFLRPAEWRWIAHQTLWLGLPPVALSFVVFMALAQTFELSSPHEGLSFTLAWYMAALLSCWAVIMVGQQVRRWA